jgi:hypothetical protein
MILVRTALRAGALLVAVTSLGGAIVSVGGRDITFAEGEVL